MNEHPSAIVFSIAKKDGSGIAQSLNQSAEIAHFFNQEIASADKITT